MTTEHSRIIVPGGGLSVLDYVTEEVERQGHDIATTTGLWRVAWMMDAWRQAQVWSLQSFIEGEEAYQRGPTVPQVERLGQMVERYINVDGFRTTAVYIGRREGTKWVNIREELAKLWVKMPDMDPLDVYRAFEEIHPFGDGNGRTGKILLNWLRGSLDNPVFPPADFWGRPIRNP